MVYMLFIAKFIYMIVHTIARHKRFAIASFILAYDVFYLIVDRDPVYLNGNLIWYLSKGVKVLF